MDAPVEEIAGALDAGVLFLCDHASPALPERYGRLGLPASQFERHIAYDPGAAALTRALAQAFHAPALLTTFSRLLIDPNRGADDPTLVMRLSDGAIVPGNAGADAAEIETRRRLFWQPYRDAVRRRLDAMLARGPVPAIVSLHSFTPLWKGQPRPWEAAVLWDSDPRMAVPLLEALRARGLCVGDNEPYDGALKGDTLYEHGTSRGLPHVLIEVRQDEIASPAGVARWAALLGDVLRPVLAAPHTHMIEHYESRTARR
jgi:predicted N-formylglutamate amidohydrolase